MENDEYVVEEVSYGLLQPPDTTETDVNKKEDDTLLCPIPSRIFDKTCKSKIITDGFGIYKNNVDQQKDGRVIYRYTLMNSNNISVQIITYGATITSIKIPDKNGIFDDIVLGYDNFDGYKSLENPYFGATIGRITGVIPKYVFTIDDDNYYVSSNFLDGHHANGGFIGFDKVLWNSYIKNDKLFLSYMSRDLEEGFPGDVVVNRSYELTAHNELIIKTSAKCSKPTPIDITSHVDWNLSSHSGGPNELYNHYLMINAARYAQVDNQQLATGKLKKVNETVLDFRIPRNLGKLIHKIPGGGYNHFMHLTRGTNKDVIFAAKLSHPISGRYVEVLTDQPGLLIYTQNNLYAHPNYVLGHPISCWCNDPVSLIEQHEGNIDIVNAAGEENVKNSSYERKSEIEKKSVTAKKSETLEKLVTKKKSETVEKSVTEIESESEKKINEKKSETGQKTIKESQLEIETSAVSVRQSETEHKTVNGKTSETEKKYTSEIKIDQQERPKLKYGPIIGKGGAEYIRHGGIRIVPLNYPEPVARKKNYINYFTYPGDDYHNTTIYKFGTVIKKKPNLAEAVV